MNSDANKTIRSGNRRKNDIADKHTLSTSCQSFQVSLQPEVIFAESVIGKRNPKYDEDNIAFETAEQFSYPGGWSTASLSSAPFALAPEMGLYEDYSRALIKAGLDNIR